MATFGSSEFAKRIADDFREETPSTSGDGQEELAGEKFEEKQDDETPTHGPKQIRISEQSSILGLKSELIKRKTEINATKQQNLDKEYTGGRRSILTVKKDEKVSMQKAAFERSQRISQYERELRREEQERMEMMGKKLKEKEVVYEALKSGQVLTYQDNSPVDFMVDFALKKKLEEEKYHGEKEKEPSTSNLKRKHDAEHYDPDEEQRVYGVSHKKFSADEETRQRQLQELLDMTKKTDVTRRKEMEEARKKQLAKHEKLNRLRIKNGLEPLPLPEPENEVAPEELEAIPLPEPVESPMEKVGF
ncbi:hypothetical protein WR25_10016 isoform A [Diploscapter pachys]|uniref:Uncharacterized protein n=1 Tax=Diploscapter pachys TaxID=2018661 RepID=A0A2A2L775_9BILA|nr:hypothetical protein WR25_10016 isoform A [Diploscapter pachys]